jgi:hypothetical protein
MCLARRGETHLSIHNRRRLRGVLSVEKPGRVIAERGICRSGILLWKPVKADEQKSAPGAQIEGGRACQQLHIIQY